MDQIITNTSIKTIPQENRVDRLRFFRSYPQSFSTKNGLLVSPGHEDLFSKTNGMREGPYKRGRGLTHDPMNSGTDPLRLCTPACSPFLFCGAAGFPVDKTRLLS
jgi:hypothetical protein